MKFRLFGAPITITRDRRKYPIRRDESGLSARKRAFAAFDQDKKPEEVFNSFQISLRTARRYYADWKKLPANFTKNYELLKKAKRIGSPSYIENTMCDIAIQLSIPTEEVSHCLEQPWGLHKIISGEFIPDYDRKNRLDEMTRKVVLLKVVSAIELSALSPKDILVLADRLLKEAQGQGGQSNAVRRIVSKMLKPNRRPKNQPKYKGKNQSIYPSGPFGSK